MFPIHTKETLYAFRKEYFKKLETTQPGIQRCQVGKITPDYTTFRSYFIMRRRLRRPKSGHRLQHGHRHLPAQMGHYKYYEMYDEDYMIAWIEWEGLKIQELESFPTKLLAERALKIALDPKLDVSSIDQ